MKRYKMKVDTEYYVVGIHFTDGLAIMAIGCILYTVINILGNLL